MKPPIKWAGSKAKLAPVLLRIWRALGSPTIVEPLAGSTAFTWAATPKIALLNDVNADLMAFMWELREGLDPAAHVDMRNDKDLFYENRAAFNTLRHDVPELLDRARLTRLRRQMPSRALRRRHAALFWYLNRAGHNGLYRVNASNGFNVPYGWNKSPVEWTPDLSPWTNVMRTRGWILSANDFAAMPDYSLFDDALVYADPPFVDAFQAYTAGGHVAWASDDQLRLLDWLERRRGPVALSNNPREDVVDGLRGRGWITREVAVARTMARSGSVPRRELLATHGIPANVLDEALSGIWE